MKLSIGIVGLPNVGKSTLFNLLTKKDITIANYPFATIDPNVGIVAVPDERLDTLARISESGKTVPAIIEFYDIAGLVRNANKGEGLGNQFLAHIREVAAIVHVVRCFPEGDIIHVENSIDPVRDMEIINTELALKDTETIEKHLEKLERDARSHDAKISKEAKMAIPAINEAREMLAKGMLLTEKKDVPAIKNLNLLTTKPQIILFNGKEGDVPESLKQHDHVIADLSGGEGMQDLIRKAYAVLNCISFFTTGKDETRAWTITKGTKAPQAAGVIHTDFEKNFIKAEVVSYDNFVAAGGWNEAKQNGDIRIEGKEYVAQDGDIFVVRHG